MDSPLCQSCAGRPELRPIILLYFDRDDGNASIGAAFEFWQPVLGKRDCWALQLQASWCRLG